MNTAEDTKMWNFYQDPKKEKEVFSRSFPRLDLVFHQLQKNKLNGKVLDLGPGDGYLVEKLDKSGYQTYGIDISDVNISKLRERLPTEISLSVANINNLPFPNETFDGIIASEIIEHLNDDDMVKAIAEIFRCLKKGGVGIITIPANENLDDKMCFCPFCEKQFHLYGHKQTFDRDRLESLFSTHPYTFVTIRKFLDFDPRWSLLQKIKSYIKAKLANLPFKYFQSFIGRYIVVVIK